MMGNHSHNLLTVVAKHPTNAWTRALIIVSTATTSLPIFVWVAPDYFASLGIAFSALSCHIPVIDLYEGTPSVVVYQVIRVNAGNLLPPATTLGLLVPNMGLEPIRLATPEPKSGTSANSASSAYGGDSGTRTPDTMVNSHLL